MESYVRASGRRRLGCSQAKVSSGARRLRSLIGEHLGLFIGQQLARTRLCLAVLSDSEKRSTYFGRCWLESAVARFANLGAVRPNSGKSGRVCSSWVPSRQEVSASQILVAGRVFLGQVCSGWCPGVAGVVWRPLWLRHSSEPACAVYPRRVGGGGRASRCGCRVLRRPKKHLSRVPSEAASAVTEVGASSFPPDGRKAGACCRGDTSAPPGPTGSALPMGGGPLGRTAGWPWRSATSISIDSSSMSCSSSSSCSGRRSSATPQQRSRALAELGRSKERGAHRDNCRIEIVLRRELCSTDFSAYSGPRRLEIGVVGCVDAHHTDGTKLRPR